MEQLDKSFTSLCKEVKHQSREREDDPDGAISLGDRFFYFLENCVAANGNTYFYFLGLVTVIFTAIFGFLWRVGHRDEGYTYPHSLFLVFQMIVTGGFDDSFTDPWSVVTFTLSLFFGLIIFAVLVGMITDAFSGMVENLSSGKTKVVARNHTLILGWNESTVRAVCQIAFLRRQWRIQNRTCFRRLCCCYRVPPSTPLAKHEIIILCNSKTKGEMEDEIKQAFADRGISRKRTRVGWDVICRVGDPTSIQDLWRVGAHRAKAILVQMTEADDSQQEEAGIQNGVTIRTMLALRVALYSANPPPPWSDLRIVVQLGAPSKCMDAITFRAPDGRKVVLVQDLSVFLNSLMFKCTSQQGMAAVLMDLIGFEGVAIRARRVSDFPGGGVELKGKTMKEAAFAWKDGVLLGVLEKDGSTFDMKKVIPGEGICPVPSRVIDAEDRAIFASASSAPTVSLPDQQLTKIEPEVVQDKTTHFSPKLQVLVCGWRKEWDDADRIAFRIRETTSTMAKGSSITFLSVKEHTSFAKLMGDVCDKSGDFIEKTPKRSTETETESETEQVWIYQEAVHIKHIEGDAADYDTLKDVITSTSYDRAIVMSTMANMTLSPMSRDTRVMAIMFMMRHIQEDLGLGPLRCVAENALDSTSMLAMCPQDLEKPEDPDFVNMQGIYARALVQALAYPKLAPALDQLFSGTPGSAQIVMPKVTTYVSPGSEILIKKLIQIVQSACPGDILLGYRLQGGNVVLVPPLDELYKPGEEDLLVVVTRSRNDREPSKNVSEPPLPLGAASVLDAPLAPLTGDSTSPPDTVPEDTFSPPGAVT